MAGPWEKYAAPAAAPGPWNRYAAPAPASDYVQPEPPPGEIIHGRDRSYISDQPEINTVRNSGASEDAVMGALKTRGRTGDMGASLSNKIVQGATFNSADEITSGLSALLGAIVGKNPATTFENMQEFQRQQNARVTEESPIASTVAEITGGALSGSKLAEGGVTLVGRMANEGVRNLVPRMAAGAAEGLGYGVTSGFFGADGGVGDRADQALENAPLSAAVGAAAVPATDLVSAIFGRLAPIFTRDPNQHGDELIARGLVRDNQSPDDLAAAVEAARTAGQGEYRAVDAAGRNVQRVGAIAAKTPGEARNEIQQTLAARQQGQGDRIGSYVDEALGAVGPDAYSTEQGIVAARRAAAGPMFARADAAPPPTGQFYDDMLQRQSVQDALRTVERVAAEKQTPISDLFTEIPNPNPTTRQVPSSVLDPSGNPVMRTEIVDPTIRVPTARGWRMIKENLDTAVNTGFASQDAATRSGAEAIKQTRNALREQLAADNPAYGEALARFRGDSEALDAIQTGRDLYKARNPDEARAALQEVDAGQRDLSRIGFAREAGVDLQNARAGQDKTLMFDKPNLQRKLDDMVEDPVARALLNDRVARERDMVRAGRTMTGGSSTYENLADGEGVSDAGGALAALLSGNPMRAIGLAGGQALGALSRRATGMNEDVANRVTDYLMSADPQQIRSLADLFREIQDRAYAPSLAPSIISAGANAPRTGNGKEDRR